MLTTKRSRIRATAAAGMVVAATAVAGVSLDASAAVAPVDTAPAAPAGIAPAAAAAPAAARPVAVPLIPLEIRPPARSRLVGAYTVASGTQTYTCVVAAGATTGAFTGPSVPEAQLIGTGGRIHHFAGPSWQSVRDGSAVTATREASGQPRPGTIPELLLKVATHTGKGILGRADYINRLRTAGGAAPAGTCTPGQTAAVPYQSIYVFWDAPAT